VKILHIFDFFSPHGGGTVDVIYKLARAQGQNGSEVTIYTSDFKLDKAYIASLPGVKVIPFPCVSSWGSFYLTPALIGASRKQLDCFDIIHLHCFRSFQNIVIGHFAKKYGIPYIVDSHGSLPRIAAGETKPKWLLRWFYDVILGYKLLENAARIVTENEFGVQEYKNFGGKNRKITVIPLFFPVEDFENLPQRGQFRRRYNLGDRKIIMSLGRINFIKGLDFLVESFAGLARIREDVSLVIVGPDDGYRKNLEQLAAALNMSDKVLFTGFLSGQDKLAALVDADVMVQPSRYEQAAWAPIEAVLCGTPVIVSRNSGSGEDVTRMDAGYLVNYGDKKEMTQTLQVILDDPAKAREKVLRAQDYIRNNLSINKKVEEYGKLYQECIEASKPLRRGK
jgi:glycosyltransferase involved in cell wall biosynthesis